MGGVEIEYYSDIILDCLINARSRRQGPCSERRMMIDVKGESISCSEVKRRAGAAKLTARSED